MLKKILILFCYAVLVLKADEYPSIHGGTFLQNLLNNQNFLNTGNYGQGYVAVVSNHSAKDPVSQLPYYPNGWKKFKMYIPPGMQIVSIVFSSIPNAVFRVHTTFKADSTRTINHASPVEGISPISTQQTVQSFISNALRFTLYNTIESGWLYFDIVEDSANSPSDLGYISDPTLYIVYDMLKNNDTLFQNWLNTTYFLTSMGDPSALVPTVESVDVATANNASQRTVSLDYGGTLYDGTPISSASSSSISSTATTSSAANSLSNSSSSNPCGAGYYQSPDTGGCIPISIGGTSSSFYSSSSLPYCDTLSSSSSGGSILPMAVACIIRPTSSSASSVSSNPCGVGFYQSPDTGGCIPISIGGTSSSSSSSSSSVVTQDASTTLQAGWNLISIPIATNQEIDVNATLDGKATIAYKFDANATSVWEKWLPGISMKLRNGQGLFAGVPPGSAPSINFSVVADTNSTKFESTSYAANTWYLLGFGYDITVEAIKMKYPNSVIFIMENGAYIKQDTNTTTIENGTGFWFKYYDTNSSI